MVALFPTRQIALSVGPLAIHWYGLMYLTAFLLGAWMLPKLQKYRQLSLNDEQRNGLLVAIILGVLIGGRLGYVLFYGSTYYLFHPLKILFVWEGGMASHGGIIGVVVGLWWFCKKEKISLLKIADVLTVPAAIGLALGRVGNFINLELYGTVTTLPWGMMIPGVEGLRHPTQIYAVIKDLLIAFICFWHLRSTTNALPLPAGQTAAVFLVLYAILRFFVEIFRDQPLGFVWGLSRGQWLTIPVLIAGIILWLYARKRASHS